MSTDTEYENAMQAASPVDRWAAGQCQTWVIDVPEALAGTPAELLTPEIAAAVAGATVVTTGDGTLTVRIDVATAAVDALAELAAELEDSSSDGE
jgi:hypothetical protein